MSPELIEAYERAEYDVFGCCVFHVGRRNAALEALLAEEHALAAAFITAANANGEPRSDEENRAAMAELENVLRHPFRRGEGRDPQGRWTPEPSLLVLGIDRGEAEALGRAFAQNAIVFIERGRAPELVMLRKLRLVLDTQVWLDWLVFDDPSTFELRSLIAGDRAEVYLDEACAAELERVLGYSLGRRRLDAQTQAHILARAKGLSKSIDTPITEAERAALPKCRDPDDQKLLEAALAARADCLVTRDAALLELARRPLPFLILTPGAFTQNRGQSPISNSGSDPESTIG